MNDSNKRVERKRGFSTECENQKATPNDIFAKDLNGEMVSPNDAGYEELIADIFATMKTATEMNTGYRTPEEVHEYMGRILDKPLDKSSTVLPPLYIDYGKPVTIGKRCFIQLYVLRTRWYYYR